MERLVLALVYLALSKTKIEEAIFELDRGLKRLWKVTFCNRKPGIGVISKPNSSNVGTKVLLWGFISGLLSTAISKGGSGDKTVYLGLDRILLLLTKVT